MEHDTDIHNPHDRFFREIWSDSDIARSFLREYLPDRILNLIQLESLRICKDSFIESGMREYHSDLLYEARFGKYPGFLYFLFEHKSHPDKLIFLQLLRYMVSIWELYRKQSGKIDRLPVVIPLVIYHGQKPWKISDRFAAHFPHSPP